jgi:transcriptional regulator with XRE-family HTH domain
MAKSNDNLLGNYLKNRRAKLDPAAFGIAPTRRRTPGLRREEVAQRANVSATWYTWLEQGRGGAPSADVLDQIACALELTSAEREHLFLLAQHRPPAVQYQEPEGVTPQLQRVLDSMEFSPAIVRTTAWDIVAWNHAAEAVLADYGTIAPEQRNILRLFFSHPRVLTKTLGWEKEARRVVGAFRSDAARSGGSEQIAALVADMIQISPEFAEIWRDHDVLDYGEGAKHFHHGTGGPMTLEYSTFKVEGRPDLGLIIFTPATPTDADCIRSIIRDRP